MKSLHIHAFVHALRYQNPASPTADEINRRRRFLEKFPEQEANILSFQDNPSCKCGGEITKAVEIAPNRDEVVSYIEGEPSRIIVPINMMGKIRLIGNTSDEWEALCKQMTEEQWMFRGLTVVSEPTGRLRVLFY